MSETAPGGLDRMQLAAVEHAGGPLEVIAGPGAGKTLLLVERAARLHEKGTPLSGIVLVTFTTRAAAEMRHRLQVRLGMDLDGQTVRSASTIHALAFRILRAAKKGAGHSGWRVADEREAFDALRQAMTETGAPRELYSPVEMAHQVETLLNLPGDAEAVADPSVSATLRRYRQILAARRRWDVSELVPRAFETMADNGEIANLFRGLCLHLMVDEWQDVSLLEYEFLKGLLRGDEIFVVGSPAQSIYEWRQAHYKSLAAQFRSDFPNLETVVLDRNYRSTPQIIAASSNVLSNGYVEARLIPVRGEGPPVETHVAYDPDAEANLVVDILQRHHREESLRYQEMAVLFREWRQSAVIEQALSAQGIPYTLGERLKFYDRPEVHEIVAYLALARAIALDRSAEKEGEASLEAVLNVPPRGIGPNSLKQLRGEAPCLTWGLFFAGMVRSDVRPQVRDSCRGLFELLVSFGHAVETTPPAQMIERVVDGSGYRAWLDEDFAADRRMYAVEALQKDAAAYTSVEAFLAAVKQNMRSRTVGTASDLGVALSSIHGAKGLEWPLVIVVGLYEGSLPHAKERAGSPSDDPPGERRLAYVAFSRAAEHLHLTTPRHIEAGGSLVAVSPSRYLQELVRAVNGKL